ncbi:hypothetical protein B0H13DRAFT_2080935 [Mycena leptocephala]|nr:hypothetical protein B0H13DRAFT_2080935 [Mycena leptocephala]
MSTYPAFSFNTTAEEVAAAFSEEIRGKNVLITGTSMNGIGFETARVMAKYANLVIITGYNAVRLKLSEEAIKKENPEANIRPLILDLGSLAAVRTTAVEVNSYAEPLHVLINNAAAAVRSSKLTEDGLEAQMATDHFGPFLFTKLLMPKLLAAATPSYTPRVVNVSSMGHRLGNGVDFELLERPTATIELNAMRVYVQAKSPTSSWRSSSRSAERGRCLRTASTPGVIMDTNITQNDSEELTVMMKESGLLNRADIPKQKDLRKKTIAQGAATTVTAAFDPRLNDYSGAFLNDSAVANNTVSPESYDAENAARLWMLTEKIIGEEFTF